MDRKDKIAKATELGLEFPKNISNDKLDELLEEAEMLAKEAQYEKPEVKPDAPKKVDKASARKEALRMRRVIITPLDERMRTAPSELYSVGNKNIGFIKKVVRFGIETLEPQIVLDTLKEKKALIQQTTIVNGRPKTTKRQGAAFAIEYLPDLTKEELEELKDK